MMTITKNKVTFSRKTWDELKAIEYFREALEALEDREELNKAISETEYFVDYDEYIKKRLDKINV